MRTVRSSGDHRLLAKIRQLAAADEVSSIRRVSSSLTRITLPLIASQAECALLELGLGRTDHDARKTPRTFALRPGQGLMSSST